ncbi:DUF748 domain-containing protein [Desulfopila aestuarii]|uniref:OmpA family protein n=1 Tax=Desulfopila aestuarii DSM 18488 TaxID=1121416 RepID=A0A1M7XVI7_9BACT|nr:DUF748 domain-containing protein [Desulfopila aestuarii]SHO42575.1 OmpA family protein [Desulfopila aestuarii DSM 18488]
MTIQNLIRKRWVKVCLGLVASLILFVALLPLGIKYYLIHWLVKNGAESASIDTLSFNPFLGRITLGSLDVQGGKRSILHHSNLVIDLDLTSLFDRSVRVEKSEYRDLYLEIEQYEDGTWRYGSFTMSGGAPKKQTLDPPDPSGPGWGFRADNVLIENCSIHVKTPEIDMTLTIDQAELNRFTTQGKNAGIFKLQGKIDDSPITLTLDPLRVYPDIEVNGDIEIAAFDLNELQKLLASSLPKLNGLFGMKGQVIFTMSDTAGMATDYRGIISLEKTDLGNSDFQTAAQTISWDGSVHYGAPSGKPAEVDTDGLLAIRGFALEQPAANLALKNESIDFDGQIDLTLGEQLSLVHDGSLTMNSIDMQIPDLLMKEDTISWKGQLSYQASGTESKVETQGGQLAIRGLFLELPTANLSLKNESIDFDGEIDLSLGEELALAHDGSLSMNSINLQLPDLSLTEDTLSWKGQVSYNAAGKDKKVASKGGLLLGGIDLKKSGSETPLGVKGKDISWNGAADVTLTSENNTTQVSLDGNLAATSLATELTEPPMQMQQGQIKVQTKSSLTLGNQLALSGKSGLEISTFNLKQGSEAEAMNVEFEKLVISDLANTSTTSISASEIRTTKITASIPGDMPLAVSIPEIHLAKFRTDDLSTFSFESLDVHNLQTSATHNNSELATLGQLGMNNIVVGKEGNFGAKDIALTDLTLLPPTEKDTQPVLSLAKLITDTFSWDQQGGLQSGTIALDKLAVNITRDKDGQMNFSRELAAMKTGKLIAAETTTQANATPTAAPAAKQQGPEQPAGNAMPIQIAAITISKDSTLAFRDQTMAVPYATSLNIEKFSLKPLDSTQPDKGSELLLEGKLEKKAPLKIAGIIKPFKRKPDLKLDLILKNYPLTSLSPYTVQAVGTALSSGNLKLTTKVALAGDKIDMKNNVVLANLKTDTISPELAAELNNQLPVPLDAALAMMRDGDGNISLDIPISGPLDNLNVGIASIIVTALNKSIVSAASSYFVYTLGPYAALAYVGMKVGEKMLQVDLPPVIFEPQAQELTDEHKDYLKRIAKMLTDNKDQDLRLTPHITPSELQPKEEDGKSKKGKKEQPAKPDAEMQKQLEQLAQQRVATITAFLIDKNGIDKLRILVSDPVIDTAKEAKPMVMLEVK